MIININDIDKISVSSNILHPFSSKSRSSQSLCCLQLHPPTFWTLAETQELVGCCRKNKIFGDTRYPLLLKLCAPLPCINKGSKTTLQGW